MNLSDATAVYVGTTEAKALYYGPQLLWNVPGWEPDTLRQNLLAFYRLNYDDNSETIFDDTSGNNRNLAVSGFYFSNEGVVGNGSVSLSQPEGFLVAPVSLNPAQPYSISMWIRFFEFKNFFSIAAGAFAGSPSSASGTLNIHGDISGGLSWNNAAVGDFSQPAFFTLFEWQHCVFVRSAGNQMSAYKNGTLIKTATGSTNYNTFTALDMGNVRYMSGFQYYGDFDAIGIWDRALTVDEIGQLYNNGAGLEI
jgi:hypothetical protein